MTKFSEIFKLREWQISPEKSVEEGQIDLLVELLELALHHHITLAVSSLPHILYMSQVTSLTLHTPVLFISFFHIKRSIFWQMCE